ncbi:MAG TPA: hypothetical protein VE781_09800 [Kineosporiaceae bacterium]|jgi:hypothetical protein|nr:hypothetical protein [Kineosporiaceae bacterium]
MRDVEVDLDEPDVPVAPARPAPRWWGAAWAAAGLVVGLLVGHVWVPAGAPEPTAPPAPAGPPVRMVLGAYTDFRTPAERTRNHVTLPVPAVVVNETAAPLWVREVRVAGPGAALGNSEGVTLAVTFPLRLPPREEVLLPFTLDVDCAVRIRPVPRITLVLADTEQGAGRPLDVTVPDLLSLWSRSRDFGGCIT